MKDEDISLIVSDLTATIDMIDTVKSVLLVRIVGGYTKVSFVGPGSVDTKEIILAKINSLADYIAYYGLLDEIRNEKT